MTRRIRQVVVEVPDHVEIDGLFGVVVDAAHCWETKQHPLRDWDINCYSTSVEMATEYAVETDTVKGRAIHGHTTDRRNLRVYLYGVPPAANPVVVGRSAWYGEWTETTDD